MHTGNTHQFIELQARVNDTKSCTLHYSHNGNMADVFGVDITTAMCNLWYHLYLNKCFNTRPEAEFFEAWWRNEMCYRFQLDVRHPRDVCSQVNLHDRSFTGMSINTSTHKASIFKDVDCIGEHQFDQDMFTTRHMREIIEDYSRD